MLLNEISNSPTNFIIKLIFIFIVFNISLTAI